MADEPVNPRLTRCILDALGLASFPLSRSTVAYEVPGWDSLAHVKVICAVEDEYAVAISTADILALKTVGDLERLVEKST